MKKLLSVLLAFVLMLTFTACGTESGLEESSSKYDFDIDVSSAIQINTSEADGEADWKDTLKEYEEFINDYVELLEDYSKNPLDPDINKKGEEMAEKAEEWSTKMDQLSTQLKGTADEAEFNQEILDISGKLMEAIGDAGIMDEVMDGVEEEYGSDIANNILDYYGEDIG